MRTLVIECATEACSVALLEGGAVVAGAFEVLGRGHAEKLVPMIAGLPDRGRAGRILVSLGPGSFTGVRVGLAAARALALAWKAECLGYPTLALVSAMARAGNAGPSTVCMAGGHGEWFMQDFDVEGLPLTILTSLAPERARLAGSQRLVAGNKAVDFAGLMDEGTVVPLAILPDAQHVQAIPQSLFTADLTPLYGRPPDARLPSSPE